MKPSLPYQGIARRALEIKGIFQDDLVVITSSREIIEGFDPYKFAGFVKGANLNFIVAPTSPHKYHVVNRTPPPCPACAHGIPLVKRR